MVKSNALMDDEQSSEFLGEEFRNKLQFDNKLPALTEFNVACEECDDVVLDYIRVGGNPSEIVKLLSEVKNNSDPNLAPTILISLHQILLKCANIEENLENLCELACNELLDVHHSVLVNVVNSVQYSFNNKKPVFIVLKDVIKLDPTLVSKICDNVSFSAKSVRRCLDYKNGIRSDVINFYLSLIEEGPSSVITSLTEQSFLEDIFKFITYDTLEVQTSILTVLHEKVAKNSYLSKTSKMHLFNTHNVSSLLQLFGQKSINNDVECDQVQKNLYDLLCSLCSSSNGVLFKEKSTRTTGQPEILNKLILSYITNIAEPWNGVLKFRFICTALSSARDIIVQYLDWFLVKFLPQLNVLIIDTLKNMFVKTVEDLLTDSSTVHLICKIVIIIVNQFGPLMNSAFSDHGFFHDPPLRLRVVIFFKSVFGIIIKFVESLKQMQQNESEKISLIECCIKENGPSNMFFEKAWNDGLCKSEKLNKESDNLNDKYYKELVKLMFNYDVLVLNNLANGARYGDIEFEQIRVHDPAVKFMVCKLFFHLYKPYPGMKHFDYVMDYLIESLGAYKSNEELELLHKIFQNAARIEVPLQETLLWVYCIRNFPPNIRHILTKIIAKTFNSIHTTQKVDYVVVENIIKADNELFKTLTLRCLEFSEKCNESLDIPAQSFIHLSPLIPAFMNSSIDVKIDRENKQVQKAMEQFTAVLLIHTMYVQESITKFLTVVETFPYDFIAAPVLQYIMSAGISDFPFKKRNVLEYKLVKMFIKQRELDYDQIALETGQINDDLKLILLWRLCKYYIYRKISNNEASSVMNDINFLSCQYRVIADRSEKSVGVLCLHEFLRNSWIINNFLLPENNDSSPVFHTVSNMIYVAFEAGHITKDFRLMDSIRFRFLLYLCEKFKAEEELDDKIIHYSSEMNIWLMQFPLSMLIPLLDVITSNSLRRRSFLWSTGWCDVFVHMFQAIASKKYNFSVTLKGICEMMYYLCDLHNYQISSKELEKSLENFFVTFPNNVDFITKDTIFYVLKHGNDDVYAIVKLILKLDISKYRFIKEYLTSNADLLESEEPLLRFSTVVMENKAWLHNYLRSAYCLCVQWISRFLLDKRSFVYRYHQAFTSLLQMPESTEPNENEWRHQYELVINNWDKCIINHKTSQVLIQLFAKNNEIPGLMKLMLSEYIQSKSYDLLEEIYSAAKSEDNLSYLLEWDQWPAIETFFLQEGIETVHSMLHLVEKVYSGNLARQYIKQADNVFQRLIGHSKFFDILRSKGDGFSITDGMELLRLYCTLARLNIPSLNATQLPFFFSIYNATLSAKDQIILQVLFYYEKNNIRVTNYRPFLWGRLAAAHYKLRNGVATTLSSYPTTSQVLDVFQYNLVESTINRYPTDRCLLPTTNCFANHEVYDPSFYIPLFSSILAPESLVSIHKFVRVGALALIIRSFSAKEFTMRKAAYVCLYRFGMQVRLISQKKESCLWTRFVGSFMAGIKKSFATANNKMPAIPGVCSVFYAMMTIRLTQPDHPHFELYKNYLINYDEFEFRVMPGFSKLFYVPASKNHEWQMQLIRWISFCAESSSDYDMLKNSRVISTLMHFCSLSTCPAQIKTRILHTLMDMTEFVKDPMALSWITSIAESVNNEDDLFAIFKILTHLPDNTNSSAVLVVLTFVQQFKSKYNVTVKTFIHIISLLHRVNPKWLQYKDNFSVLLLFIQSFVPRQCYIKRPLEAVNNIQNLQTYLAAILRCANDLEP